MPSMAGQVYMVITKVQECGKAKKKPHKYKIKGWGRNSERRLRLSVTSSLEGLGREYHMRVFI